VILIYVLKYLLVIEEDDFSGNGPTLTIVNTLTKLQSSAHACQMDGGKSLNFRPIYFRPATDARSFGIGGLPQAFALYFLKTILTKKKY
jgi:hypothetical protein